MLVRYNAWNAFNVIFFSRVGISNLESRKAVGNMILSIRARGRLIGLLLILS